ncbi:OadG-related small transporter subunit [Erysipelothrix sp. HDW6C]|nr:OadG-related small transporter subunit [Erysipelothrix sp. HDW6C]
MNVDMVALTEAFKIMGIGMGGIFLALGIIYAASVVLLKVFPEDK